MKRFTLLRLFVSYKLQIAFTLVFGTALLFWITVSKISWFVHNVFSN